MAWKSWGICGFVAAMLLVVFPPAASGELRVLEPIVNLGKIRGGAPVTHHFFLVNEGPEAVELLEVSTSCGCLSPRLEKGRLDPGGKSSFPVFIRSLGQPAGPHTWTALLRYRQGQSEKEVSLKVLADIVNEITLQPAAVTVFTAKELAQDIFLIDSRTPPLQIETIRTSNPNLKGSVAGQEGGRIRLQVLATGSFPVGRHDEVLNVYTNDPFYRQLTVPITIIKEVPKMVTVIPEKVTWKLSPVETPLPIIVRLRASAGEGLEIEKVLADHPAISCRWAAGKGSWATVRIQIDPHKGNPPPAAAKVEVYLCRPERQCLIIPVDIDRE